MRQIKKNELGFSVVEVVMVIVIIVILSVVGWMAYKNHHKTTKAPVVTIYNTTHHSNTAADAVDLVQHAYNTADSYVMRSTNASQGEVNSIKSSLSTSLYDKLSAIVANGPGYDPILCDQATPSSVTAVLGNNSNGIVTVLVNETYGSSKQQVTTTVDLDNLQIDSITCPS